MSFKVSKYSFWCFLSVFQTLASTVVQLFSTKGSNDVEWHKQETGVLCLVKDNPRKSYFFRLYCINQKMLLWEHEIYNRMDYLAPRPFLHTFEGEVSVIPVKYICKCIFMKVTSRLLCRVISVSEDRPLARFSQASYKNLLELEDISWIFSFFKFFQMC